MRSSSSWRAVARLCCVAGLLLAFAAAWPAGAGAADSTTQGLEARLQRLEAEAEIRRQLQDYMEALRSRDWDAYVGFFTRDGALVMAEGTVTGHEAIKTRMAEATARMARAAEGRPVRRSADLLSNIVIAVDGDTATAGSRFTFIRENEAGGFDVSGSGRYIDVWAREAGAWKLRERIVDYDLLARPAAAAD